MLCLTCFYLRQCFPVPCILLQAIEYNCIIFIESPPHIHFFLECIYRNGSAGLCDRHALNIVWYVWAATVFHSSLHPESLFYLLPHPQPEVCLLAILTGARYYVIVVFSCVFLKSPWHLGDNCTEYFLFVYWPFVSLLRITYSDHLSVL